MKKLFSQLLRILGINPSVKKLSPAQISEICAEIEQQWLFLLMTRAVFPADFEKADTYWESPSFYSNSGLKFSVTLPKGKTEIFKKGSEGLANWLNQNYVIRLYGILDKHKILYLGRTVYGNKVMILLYELRQKVGAHGSGRSNPKKSHLKKATDLINELFDQEIDSSKVQHYELPINTVLAPMKDKAIEFVKSLGQ